MKTGYLRFANTPRIITGSVVLLMGVNTLQIAGCAGDSGEGSLSTDSLAVVSEAPDASTDSLETVSSCDIEVIAQVVRQMSEHGVVLFEAGMSIDADGAPNAYNPENTGLDYLGNAGTDGNWWALAVDEDGEPYVQGPNDPYPGYYVSTTALEDQTRSPEDPLRYVDSTNISYVVLPIGHDFQLSLGDFGFVYNRASNKGAYAIIADLGPRDHLGEGSIALATALGIPSSPKTGGASDQVVYVLFGASGDGKPHPQSEIDKEASRLLGSLGDHVWDVLRQGCKS